MKRRTDLTPTAFWPRGPPPFSARGHCAAKAVGEPGGAEGLYSKLHIVMEAEVETSHVLVLLSSTFGQRYSAS